LEPQKNLPALLNIFARLSHQEAGSSGRSPHLRLRLFGDGSQKAGLMTLARKLGVEPSVEFCGAIPRERVREAVQSCHLFCFTSLTEGQCLAALEILAEGRPIIATAVGAFSDMLTQPATGAVVPSGDEPAFLSAVNDLLARQKRGLLSPPDTVQAYQLKFDREAVVRKYVELLTLKTTAPEPPRRDMAREVHPTPCT
jgi:glycosyltransferase involved in cell wall biosynthesis